MFPIDFGFNRVTGQPFRLVNLLGTSTKIKAGERKHLMTKVLYMLPHKYAGQFSESEQGQRIIRKIADIAYVDPDLLTARVKKWNACPNADSCKHNCLAKTSGHLAMDDNQMFMFAKTVLYLALPYEFAGRLEEEIQKHEQAVHRKRKKTGEDWIAAVRLNGGTDIDWAGSEMFSWILNTHPNVRFYDYTKVEKRMTRFLGGQYPDNYHLTFSWGNRNDRAVKRVLDQGGNVAVVIRDQENPGRLPTHNGDDHDGRFLDPGDGHLIALKPKGGVAKKDTSGFVKDSWGEVKLRLASV